VPSQTIRVSPAGDAEGLSSSVKRVGKTRNSVGVVYPCCFVIFSLRLKMYGDTDVADAKEEVIMLNPSRPYDP
jgi:hypothetical protein